MVILIYWKRTTKDVHQEGRGINRKNSNDYMETPQLAPALFSHLPGFYNKTGILNPSQFFQMALKLKIRKLSITNLT